MVSSPQMKRLRIAGSIGSLILGLIVIAVPVSGKAQEAPQTNQRPTAAVTRTDFESRKTGAYQKFHRGAVREAARDVRQLANETADKFTKTYLLRDLTEICSAAYDAACTLDAEIEAFEIARSEASLNFLIPELYSYFVSAQVWLGNEDALKVIFNSSGLNASFNAAANPSAAARANLAAVSYFLRSGNYRAAEEASSAVVLSLLLMDPKDEYGISKILVDLLEALIGQQDLVGAVSLVRVIDPYLRRRLNHEGPYWAKYVSLSAQLVAFVNRHKDAGPMLAQAVLLNQRLDIDDGVKTYRLSVGNSLQSLALLLDGQAERAIALHSQHPMQFRKNEIIQRGEFDTYQEFFFAVSDILFQTLRGDGDRQFWAPLFDKPVVKWKLGKIETKNIESYRGFARGLIISGRSKFDAAKLYQQAARERIENFETTLQGRFEGFQLPSSVDLLIIGAALTSIAEYPPVDQYDLMLRGNEVMLRSLRHQLSDFSVLIGSQISEGARSRARSYHLLVQQKRSWELQQIAGLLEGQSRNVGAVVNVYSELVASVSRLGDAVSANPGYAAAMGYPTLKQLQMVLNDDEVFVAYIPTFVGIGRLCVSKTSSVSAFASVDKSQLIMDIRLLQLALTADDAADDKRDAQFPAESAVRLTHYLFDGLDHCMSRGGHVNVALPLEVSGIPLAALLEDVPPPLDVGFDLRAAKWLGNSFSFSTTVSARHLLGLKRLIGHQQAWQPYLGVGNPILRQQPSHFPTVGAIEYPAGVSNGNSQNYLGGLSALPETAEELGAVQRLLGASESEILIGQRATEEAFRSKDLGAYDIIHFATHGLLKGDIDGLSEPALVLSPIDPSDSFDDGLLSASEITRLSLNARLIVLSACNTAKIDTAAANLGATDLQAAFSAAGAPTLLASLWPVETTTARDLIINFFQSWQKQTNKSASRSLAEATRIFLMNTDRAHQHPRFWASFVILGYGDILPLAMPSRRAMTASLIPMPDDAGGEVLDAVAYQGRVLVSMQGDWNGHKMAGIVRDPSRRENGDIIHSHEIGAGKLIVDDSSLYVAGYRISEHPIPVLSKIGPDGKVDWQHTFEDLIDYTPVDGVIIDDNVFVLVESFAASVDQARRAILIKLGANGREIARESIDFPPANILVGQKSIMLKVGKRIVIAANSQDVSALDPAKPHRLGIPSWCPGALKTTVYYVDPASLRGTKISAIDDFQAFAARDISGHVVLGGQTRSRCARGAAAVILEITEHDSVRQLWMDDDPFPSNVQSFDIANKKLSMVVKRERPTGVRLTEPKQAPAYSKRWGDNGRELWEFSVLTISLDGQVIERYDSSFGLSSFAQGMFRWRDDWVIFGSLGGRPAISISALN